MMHRVLSRLPMLLGEEARSRMVFSCWFWIYVDLGSAPEWGVVVKVGLKNAMDMGGI